MTPEDIKDLKIILATWKYEIEETIEDKFKQIIPTIRNDGKTRTLNAGSAPIKNDPV